MGYTKLLEKARNDNIALYKIKEKDVDIIHKLVYNIILTENEKEYILKNIKKSNILQEAVCKSDSYDEEFADKIVQYISTQNLPLFMQKEKVFPKTMQYIIDNVTEDNIKEFIESHSDIISKKFKHYIINSNDDYLQSIDYVPFSYFDNIDAIANEKVNSNSCDELLMTAISNNKNISAKIRNEAFDKMVDVLSIDNFTNYMISKLFQSSVERIFDYPKESIKDAEDINYATDTIIKLIKTHQLKKEHEYSLLQKLQDKPDSPYFRILFNTLLKNTKEQIILKTAYEFNPLLSKDVIRENKYCDIFLKEDFISESISHIRELNKTDKRNMDIINEKIFLFNSIIKNPLSVHSYAQLHSFAKTNDKILDVAIATSKFISTNDIKEIFGDGNSEIVKARIVTQQILSKNGLNEESLNKILNKLFYVFVKKNEKYFLLPNSIPKDNVTKCIDKSFSTFTEDEFLSFKESLHYMYNTAFAKTLDFSLSTEYNITNAFNKLDSIFCFRNNSISIDKGILFTLSASDINNIIDIVCKSQNNSISSLFIECINEKITDNENFLDVCDMIFKFGDLYEYITKEKEKNAINNKEEDIEI